MDYVLSQQGSLTKIIPLAGSPFIRPDDPLEVSYSYAVDPSLKYSTTTLRGRLGAVFPWVAVSYEHVLSDQSRIAGTPSPQSLINENLDRVEMELRGQWRLVRAQSSVAYEILRSTIVDSNAIRFSQQLSYQPRPELIAQISGDEYWVDYPGENRRANSYLVRGTVDWVTPVGFSIAAFTGYREYHDTGIPSDQIVDCGIRLHWTYERIEVSPSLTWTDYRGRLSDLRGELRITRRWF